MGKRITSGRSKRSLSKEAGRKSLPPKTVSGRQRKSLAKYKPGKRVR